MEVQLAGNPDFGEATVTLNPSEEILIESGAMSRMSPNLQAQFKALGGFFKAMFRSLVGGESVFVGKFSDDQGGWLTFAPGTPGTVHHKKLNGNTMMLTAGSFLACTPDITLKTKFGGLRSFFSSEGAFLLEASGTGDLFFNCFGGGEEKVVNGQLTVDTGHVVAWEPTLDYKIRGMGGLKSTLMSGEGLVMDFTGQGRIWLQTRTLDGKAGWVTPYLMGA